MSWGALESTGSPSIDDAGLAGYEGLERKRERGERASTSFPGGKVLPLKQYAARWTAIAKASSRDVADRAIFGRTYQWHEAYGPQIALWFYET